MAKLAIFVAKNITWIGKIVKVIFVLPSILNNEQKKCLLGKYCKSFCSFIWKWTVNKKYTLRFSYLSMAIFFWMDFCFLDHCVPRLLRARTTFGMLTSALSLHFLKYCRLRRFFWKMFFLWSLAGGNFFLA